MKRLLLSLLIISVSLWGCVTTPKEFAVEIEKPKIPMSEVCIDTAEFIILDYGETCEDWGLPLFSIMILKEDAPAFYKYIRQLEIRSEKAAP